MKTLFTLFAISILSIQLHGQSYTSPESVEYDAANNRWLVSSTGSSSIQQRDAGGNISLFVGVPSPYGLQIVGDTVYVCSSGRIRGYSLIGANPGTNIQITGAGFLNGLAADTSGNLYATDFSSSPRKIYRINIAGQYYTTFAITGTTPSPNGIIHDPCNNRLVFVNWGTNAPIKAISLADSTITTLLSTSYSNIDGIARDGVGNFYISAWSPSPTIVRYPNNFSTPGVPVVTTGISNPADIYFATSIDTLAIPNATTSGANANTVRFVGITPAVPSFNFITVNDTVNCAGDTTTVMFGANALFTCGNKFYVLLSDSTGNFTNCDTIGSASSITAGSIIATIPAGAIPASGYRIKVISTMPPLSTSDNGYDLIIDTCSSAAPAISNVSITANTDTSYCYSAPSYSVNFSTANTFNSGNIFYVFLSNATGSFAAPDTIGNLTGTGSGTISVTFPVSDTTGNYRLKVVATNPPFTGPDNGFNFRILNCTVGINEIPFVNYSLAPNPFKTTISISNPLFDITAIRVFNILGETVFSMSRITEQKINLELDYLNSGIYLLEINTPTGRFSKKICKE